MGRVLTVNSGSSSIKLGLFEGGRCLARENAAPEQAESLIGSLLERYPGPLAGIGHRVVHGGLAIQDHQRVTPELMAMLRQATEFDLAHLPREIDLMERAGAQFPNAPQVACFDTVFHKDIPRTAQLLPIPRKYLEAGFRRFGFHGLSYTYLLEQLPAKSGRVILAHLGSGASMAAVRDGNPVDTSMGFTPVAGLVMGTRPGDLDPGFLAYAIRKEAMTAERAERWLNQECGLAGVSGGTSDVRELSARYETDTAAAEALDLFCYQAKKYIGAYAAVLNGLDTLVFSGGIGEHAPNVRAAICAGMDWLGIELDADRNRRNEPLISAQGGRVSVRVIPTDEEATVAEITLKVIQGRS